LPHGSSLFALPALVLNVPGEDTRKGLAILEAAKAD